MFNRTTSTKFIAPRRSRMKIRIPKLEIRNKPKHSNPIIKIRNGIIWNFMLFDHLHLFRFSDFVLRVFCSPFLASFAPSRLAPWNTDSTKIELFAISAIPRGESSFIRFSKLKFHGKFQICLVSSTSLMNNYLLMVNSSVNRHRRQ